MSQTPLKGPLCTRASLALDLKTFINPGDTILLHTSLRSLGFVVGGAETVIEALLDVLTPSGTLVVPTHTGDNSDPSNWQFPPVPESWWQEIRDTTPAYDPRTSRTRGMGVLPELLRTWPGALRSAHPQTSFAAIGENAEFITSGHALDCMMGEQSPLAKLEELGAKVVLLGVGFDVCTTLHLAEYRWEGAETAINSFAANVNGKREWISVEDIAVKDHDFEQLGKDYQKTGRIRNVHVGAAKTMAFDMKDLVAFATHCFSIHRTQS